MIFQIGLIAFFLFRPDPVFTVENRLSIPRNEVMGIPFSRLEKMMGGKFDPLQLQVVESSSNLSVPKQWVDLDQDGVYEELLFFAELKANETKSYSLTLNDQNTEMQSPRVRTFVRFVPERIDDIAWENDKVAFRTYGPEAQRLVDEKQSGGTLTSGIDAWLKRVDYPIIDKWYQKYVDGGSYHTDSGEGYDPYHVGDSRGIGGIGVWLGDSLYVSKNFTEYKIIANGPLRTVFELTYAPWSAEKTTIQETKRISIDLGSQLYHLEVKLKSDSPLPNLTAGITLHDGTGQISSDPNAGWISYWEDIDGSKLGTGIVASSEDILDQLEIRTAAKEQSHIYMLLNPERRISYYAGFGWEKAGEFSSVDEWNKYLSDFSEKLASPLLLNFTK